MSTIRQFLLPKMSTWSTSVVVSARCSLPHTSQASEVGEDRVDVDAAAAEFHKLPGKEGASTVNLGLRAFGSLL